MTNPFDLPRTFLDWQPIHQAGNKVKIPGIGGDRERDQDEKSVPSRAGKTTPNGTTYSTTLGASKLRPRESAAAGLVGRESAIQR